MKISIVTISFDQAAYLEAAIRSVISQEFDGLEYIVVDAGSRDGSRDIIDRYRDRIDHVILEPDQGPADGLNKGFSLASGNYYGFVNADDLLLPGALRRVARAFARHRDADVVYGHADVVDASGALVNRFYSRRFSPRRQIYGAGVIAQQSTFFSADIFHRAGGFNVSNRIAWDGELWLDLAMAGARFQRVDEFWSAFRIYESSITGSGRHAEAYRQWMGRMFEKVMRRKRGPRDKAIGALYKAHEYATHPMVLLSRLRHGPINASR